MSGKHIKPLCYQTGSPTDLSAKVLRYANCVTRSERLLRWEPVRANPRRPYSSSAKRGPARTSPRARKQRPFLHIDCASLPADLIEAELFGHEKGAYTNAQGARAGLIEAAEDGTVFLDEIGELAPALQAKLLAVLERRVLRRIGSVRERPIGASFIGATNRDLAELVTQGRFRSDLYYRLNVLSLTMPPLRVRGEDVLLLAHHFAAQTARRYDLPPAIISPEALEAIWSYGWPGNVRELKHQVQRAALLHGGGTITSADLGLPQGLATASVPNLLGLTLDEAERMLITETLRNCGGNVSEAARRLETPRGPVECRARATP